MIGVCVLKDDPEDQQFGQNCYSEDEDDNPVTQAERDREIYGGRFGHSQNPHEPDYMPYGLANWAGVSQTQNHIKLGWRPPMQVHGSSNGTVGQTNQWPR